MFMAAIIDLVASIKSVLLELGPNVAIILIIIGILGLIVDSIIVITSFLIR